MKKTLFFILSILIIALGFILLVSKKQTKKNGFNRNLYSLKLKQDNFFILPSKYFSFSGSEGSMIKIKDLKQPYAIFMIDYSLKNLKRARIKIPDSFAVGKEPLYTSSLNDLICVTNGKTGDIAITNEKLVTVKRIKLTQIQFDQSQLASNNEVVLRTKSIRKLELNRDLTKVFLHKKKLFTQKYRLEKQLDGFFCTDGLMRYDPTNSLLLYMYFYRGEFLCLDSNLQLLYKGKTIDTIKRAQLKIQEQIKNIGGKVSVSKTQANPASNFVNRNYTSDSKYIYIMSALKADNEKMSDFKENQIIDVYQKQNGDYLNSFYIPKYKGIKLREFQIIKNRLFAIFGNYLIAYQFSELKT